MINILICVKPFYFNYMLYSRFPLHNSTGEARPHLPPLIARPCSILILLITGNNQFSQILLDQLLYPTYLYLYH